MLRPARLPLASVLLVLPLLPACESTINPATGRREIVLMSPADERRVNAETAELIESQIGLLRDPALEAYVESVGRRLAAHSPRKDVLYEFRIVQMEEPNAFALPAGNVYVSQGLLALANSEAELAHVLGHEIGHVAARHAARQDALVRTFGLAPLLSELLWGGGEEELPSQETLGGPPAPRYARSHEREADRIGQELASAAGVSPSGMARFLRALDNFEKLERGFSSPQSYFSSHPGTLERIAAATTREQVREWRGERETTAGLPRSDLGADVERDRYLDHVEGMPVETPASEGVFVEDRFIHLPLGFSLRFPRGWQHINRASEVVSLSPHRDGVVVLQLHGPGDDPAQAADEWARAEGLQLRGGERLRIGGRPAYRASAVVATSVGSVDAEITWIAFDGSIYRLIGGGKPGQAQRYRGIFRKFASSFRELAPEDAALVTELRLRTVRAQEGETLAELSARTGNEWDATRTAVANALFIDDRLRAGQRIKIAVREPYRLPEEGPGADATADGAAETPEAADGAGGGTTGDSAAAPR